MLKCGLISIDNEQDSSHQGEALNVPTAFEGLWSSSNNIKTLYEVK